MNIFDSTKFFVDDAKILSSLCLSYGNAECYESHCIGVAQEIEFKEGCFFSKIRPLTKDSIFDLASLTKLFTCVAILMLIESRQLKMTDGVYKIDKRFRRLKEVSIYDLLSYRTNIQSSKRIDKAASRQEAESIVFEVQNKAQTPQKLYTDMNALILKYIIEAIAGCSYDSFLNQNIFIPLAMNRTSSRPLQISSDIVDYRYEHFILDGEFKINHEPVLGETHDPKARILMRDGGSTGGHAGLFSTLADMTKFTQALLSGRLLSFATLRKIGTPQTGYTKINGGYQQYMGLLCFAKSSVKRLSEVPHWMSDVAFGLGGYTGNHICVDIENGVFDIMLGNRCHNRITKITPEKFADKNLAPDYSGTIIWPDGRNVHSSYKYVYLKDKYIHYPVLERLKELSLIR